MLPEAFNASGSMPACRWTCAHAPRCGAVRHGAPPSHHHTAPC